MPRASGIRIRAEKNPRSTTVSESRGSDDHRFVAYSYRVAQPARRLGGSVQRQSSGSDDGRGHAAKSRGSGLRCLCFPPGRASFQIGDDRIREPCTTAMPIEDRQRVCERRPIRDCRTRANHARVVAHNVGQKPGGYPATAGRRQAPAFDR